MIRPLGLLVAALLLFALAGSSFANGAPVRIPLSKLAGVVNYGTEPAQGLAEVTVVEGDVLVVSQGLPRLTSELYQAWLVNSGNGERLSVGKFNTTADGTSRTQVVVNIGNREFDLFVVTVEPEPDSAATPDDRIVLAGYWPGKEPGAALTAAAATVRAGGTPPPAAPTAASRDGLPPGSTVVSTRAPSELPRTGGPGFEILALALVVLGGGAVLLARGVKA